MKSARESPTSEHGDDDQLQRAACRGRPSRASIRRRSGTRSRTARPARRPRARSRRASDHLYGRRNPSSRPNVRLYGNCRPCSKLSRGDDVCQTSATRRAATSPSRTRSWKRPGPTSSSSTAFAGNLEIELETRALPTVPRSPCVVLARRASSTAAGTGLSDRMREAPTLETRKTDLAAVLETASSEAASMCLLFAATYPKRTLGLILDDPISNGTATPGYPCTSWTPAQIEAARRDLGAPSRLRQRRSALWPRSRRRGSDPSHRANSSPGRRARPPPRRSSGADRRLCAPRLAGDPRPDARSSRAEGHRRAQGRAGRMAALRRQRETRYAKSGDVAIAYQVVGDGPIDLVFVPGFGLAPRAAGRTPALARFLERLASFSRLILFDKRGTGLSDRVAGRRRRSRRGWTTSGR